MTHQENSANKMKSIVLVPYWVLPIVKMHNANLTVMLDPDFVKKHFSKEDAVHILTLNTDNTKNVFGVDRPCYALLDNWQKDRIFLAGLEMLKPIHAPTLVERLFSLESKQVRFERAYSIDDPSGEYTFVTIYPGYFGEPDAPSHQKALIVEILKLSYAYSLYHTVAQEPLFKSYIHGLSFGLKT